MRMRTAAIRKATISLRVAATRGTTKTGFPTNGFTGEPVNRFRKPEFLTARFHRGGRGKDDVRVHTFAWARRVDVNFF